MKKLFLTCTLIYAMQGYSVTQDSTKLVTSKDTTSITSKVKKTDYEKLFDKKEVESSKGVVTIHKIDNKSILFEYPLNMLERSMLLGSTVSEISNNAHSVIGYKSKMPMHIKFSKSGKNIHLCMLNDLYTTDDENLLQAVEKSTIGAIFKSFPIKAYSPDSSAVVFDITDLFLTHIEDLDPFDPAGIFGTRPFTRSVSFKKEQSHLASIKSFADNFSVNSYLTYESTVRVSGGAGRTVENKMPVTALMNRSFLILPEKPMQPRIADPRINIFPTGKANFSQNENRGTLPVYYARKWDLQPKNMKAWQKGELVEPIKPIVFYIDDNFPEMWKDPIKKGVEQWNVAFEKIGFKNAVQAKFFPKNDPEFDPDNLKYSCVRYQPIDIKNAMGPSWFDPRSGEIINASVILYHDIIKLVQNWLYVQTAQTDKRIRNGIIPREIMDDAIRYVVAHEVGHCLSLMHNMGSSAAIPTDKLRDPKFTQKYGTTYSIMDYARFNYVAQPGDMEKGVRLTPPDMGIYDYFSIKWLYSPIPQAKNPEEESKILAQWIHEKSGDPKFRYGKQQVYTLTDPSSQAEDLGDDLVKSSEYGVKNLKFIMKNLNKWLKDTDTDLSMRETLYKGILSQYSTYLMHVYNIKGGIYLNERKQGDKLPSYEFVPIDYQRRAQEFLCEQLNDLDWLEPEDLLREIPLLGNQSIKIQKTLMSLISADRYAMTNARDKDRPSFTIEQAQDIAIHHLFSKTIKGEKLNEREITNQNLYIDYLGLITGLDRKNDSKSGNTIAFTDALTNQEAVAESMLWETHRSFNPEEVSGFGFFRGLAASASPRTHIYFARLIEVKKIIENRNQITDAEIEAHYDLLLRRINGLLK